MGRHRRPGTDVLTELDLRSDEPVIRTVALDRPRLTTTPTIGITVVARHERAAQRATRRAETRRKLLAAGAVTLAALLAIGLAVVLLPGEKEKGSTGPAAVAPRQSTLLVQVAGPDGAAAASALLGITPSTRQGAAVLVPSGLLVDLAGTGNMPFGETVTLPAERAPLDALTDLLGVRVEDGWVLSEKGLAALVDEVGGVQVSVDATVIVEDDQGRSMVFARPGSRKLTGKAAAAYATYLADGEPETMRLARFQEVLDRLLRELPTSSAETTTALSTLSTGSRSTLQNPLLADMLVTFREAAAKGRLRYDVLPVNDIDTGAAVDSYGLDSSAAGALLQSLFAGSLQRDASGASVSVLVENGVGIPDLVAKARSRLVDDGFQFKNGGNAPELSSTDNSVVLIEDGAPRSQARGARVAKALGFPSSAIEINPRGQTVADIIVILGADFRP